MIYILSGNRQSGKTTALFNWIDKYKPEVYGVLSPVRDGIRKFYSLSKDEMFSFSVIDEDYREQEIIRIRKYVFYKSAFERAENEIRLGLYAKSGFTIIDELGPLELQAKGFYNIARQCVEESRKGGNSNFIFVIRTSHLEKMKKLFGLKKGETDSFNNINPEQFKNY